MTAKRVVFITTLLGTTVVIAMMLALMTACEAGKVPAASTGGEAGGAAPETKESAGAEGIVRMTDAQLKQFGVVTGIAGPGRLRLEVILPGEVALDADRVAHVVPRVSGVVREVRKNLGDTVHRGEVMAILESRELADSTAAYLAARERVSMAQSNYDREVQLRQKKISPEQDFIQAQNALAEGGIELRTAEQKLRALGFSDEYISRLPERPEKAAILYEMTAPFDATIIERHISLGEVLRDESPAFIIADLSTVWVNLDVHQKDLPLIQIGQRAAIGEGNVAPTVEGRISFLEPIAVETNRTIHARVALANAGGKWRPGLFVTAHISVENVEVPVLVPNDSLVMVGGKTCVFLKEGDGFKVRPVSAGRTNGTATEITGGLAAGQVYVVKGAFTLKSELGKPVGDD